MLFLSKIHYEKNQNVNTIELPITACVPGSAQVTNENRKFRKH